jgi:hypothetical protein
VRRVFYAMMDSAVRYLGVDIEEALALFEGAEV